MSSQVRHNVRHFRDAMDDLAVELDINAACLHAVAAAEVGEMPTGRYLVMRFENHAALRRAPHLSNLLRVDTHDPVTGEKLVAWDNRAHWYNPGSGWRLVHTGSPADEWGALMTAAAIEPDIAYRCASYGVGQIMGWHYELLGFETVQDMVGQALKGHEEQFRQWKRLLERLGDGQLLPLMRAQDWEGFAAIYNGPGQVEYYGGALAKHYASAVAELAKPVVEEPDFDLDTWAGRQGALAQLGYDPGPADGSPGPRTTAAVVAFQGDSGLDGDGIWGANTRAAMVGRLA